MRMEKAYKVSADMTNEVTGVEAGLGRFLRLDKPGFIGRDALVTRDLRWALVYLEVDASAADPVGGEGVFSAGKRIGVVTTAGFGHYVGKSLAWAYVDPDHAAPGTEMEVSVLGELRPAMVQAEPAWDPGNERARA